MKLSLGVVLILMCAVIYVLAISEVGMLLLVLGGIIGGIILWRKK